jgi:glyoxylase-like metal-dependent hydrolase (beta-lactamase superfamily II)
MRYIVSLFFITVSVFGFNYHLNPYPIADNVYCFFGLGKEANEINGGNIVNSCYVEIKDGYVVIDSGPTYSYAQQAYNLMQQQKRLPVKYVINTSSDDPHILGNGFYKEQGATILAPKGYDANREPQLAKRITPDAFINTHIIPPDRLITKDTNIKCCSMQITINKIISSDDNYLTVFIPSRNVLFAGDMIYNNRIPALKKGRSLIKWIEALKKIEKQSWERVISAHGTKSRYSALRNTQSYLTILKERVEESIKNGLSKEDAMREIQLLSFIDDSLYDRWHKQNVAVAYDELSKVVSKKVLSTPKKIEQKREKKNQQKEASKKQKSSKKNLYEPNIRYHSFSRAIKRAQREKRIVLLKVRSDNCPFCDELDRTLKSNNQVKRLINKHYIMVQMNNSRDHLPLGIQVGVTPSLVFIRPDQKRVEMIIPGIETLSELINVLKEGIKDGKANGYLK